MEQVRRTGFIQPGEELLSGGLITDLVITFLIDNIFDVSDNKTGKQMS